MIELVRGLAPSDFREKVRIGPVWGLEDSSRYWSADLILEHLIEVGTGIAIVIVELSHGEKPSVQADTADAKSEGGQNAWIIDDYVAFLDDESVVSRGPSQDRLSLYGGMESRYGPC